MKPVLLIGLLISTASISPLPAALSPIPVVEIISVNLPKVEIRFSNPSKTEECRIWYAACSWAEQNKWFTLRAKKGGPDWEVRRRPQDYTKNTAGAESIPAEGSVVFKYDFSDGRWVLPEAFTPGDWAYEIQAHLQIPFEVDAHRFGIFTGHVASGWYDVEGREVEKPGNPERDEIHAAIESATIPWERLIALVEQWDVGKLPRNKSIADYIGDFPWDNLKCRYLGFQSICVLLPDGRILRFYFYGELPGSFRTVKASRRNTGQKKFLRVQNTDWLSAKEALEKTPARSISSVALFRRGEGFAKFKRAFDRKGRIDKTKMQDRFYWFP